jgi:nucleoside-diphosphate-sugar epimerase
MSLLAEVRIHLRAVKHARTQEEMLLTVGRSHRIPGAVLRYFNVFGSRQALSNPYTGVAKNFALRISASETPVIYEDDLQTRDFIHVSDIVQANTLALQKAEADGQVFNVGTSQPWTILELARTTASRLCKQVSLKPAEQFRAGDVRHCLADIPGRMRRSALNHTRCFPAGLRICFPTRFPLAQLLLRKPRRIT